jgi:asparagine synthase (glutamine-hydrolysing)
MCGIAGIYSFNQTVDIQKSIATITTALAHRGPEAEGFYVDTNIGLGHRRLSIIDLSAASNQPLYDSTNNYIMVFNGEVFNYNEVKFQLSDYPFKTNGDGEVVLAAYIKWGIAAFEKFKGFFAFAIYNKSTSELIVVRDRLGVKPLYYYLDEDKLIFASEIRAILKSNLVPKKINTMAVQNYLHMQSIYAPHTIIANVFQLKNGEYATIKNKQLTIATWWDIKHKNTTIAIPKDKENVKKEVNELLQKVVERRLVADVPVAAFLSGGIDSSAIVALMAQQKSNLATFNIAFAEKEYDESAYAEIIAKKFNTNHHKITLSPNDFLNELPNALQSMDTPSADGINSYVVSKAIVKNNIKVAVSGVGGDELFAGYPGFKFWSTANNYKWFWKLPTFIRNTISLPLPNNGKWGRVKNLIQLPNLDINGFYPLMREVVNKKQIELITNTKFNVNYIDYTATDFPVISQYSIAELLGYTQNTLLKDTDQYSMAVALEVREPFFDSDLIEYVLQIPDSIKQPAFAKQLLVESLGNLLPNEIVHRPKKGFVFPWENWMRNELFTFCQTQITSLSNRNEFDSNAINDLWKKFCNKEQVRWTEVWQLVVLEHWLQQHIDA